MTRCLLPFESPMLSWCRGLGSEETPTAAAGEDLTAIEVLLDTPNVSQC